MAFCPVGFGGGLIVGAVGGGGDGEERGEEEVVEGGHGGGGRGGGRGRGEVGRNSRVGRSQGFGRRFAFTPETETSWMHAKPGETEQRVDFLFSRAFCFFLVYWGEGDIMDMALLCFQDWSWWRGRYSVWVRVCGDTPAGHNSLPEQPGAIQ